MLDEAKDVNEGDGWVGAIILVDNVGVAVAVDLIGGRRVWRWGEGG